LSNKENNLCSCKRNSVDSRKNNDIERLGCFYIFTILLEEEEKYKSNTTFHLNFQQPEVCGLKSFYTAS